MSQSPSPSSSGGPRNPQVTNQRRASTPKVRTGCVTCKSRHVKCDERKPSCFRCEKAGMPCAGYVTNLEPRMSRKAARSAEHLRSGPRPLQMIRPAVATPTIFAEKDIIYHDLFRYCFVDDLTGYLHAEYWSRILLCESTQEECIQHAILAIGALSQAMFLGYTSQRDRRSTNLLVPNLSTQYPKTPVLNTHDRAAIHHQNQAISLCLQRTRESQNDLPARTLLTLTLLLVAYELLQGDMERADGLMTSGIRLLQDSLTMLRDKAARRCPPANTSHRAEQEDSELEEDMEYILPLLSGMAGQSNSTATSPSSPNLLVGSDNPNIQFPVFGQASSVKFMYLWGSFHGKCTAFITQAMQRTFGGPTSGSSTPHDHTPSSTLQQEQSRLFALLRQWQPIITEYSHAVKTDDYRTRKALRSISLQYYTDLIYLAWCLDSTDTACDGLELDFAQILRITDEVLLDAEPLSTIAFTFAGGSLAGPLILVATKCRNRDIRLKALQKIRNMSWRDGTWDTKVLVCCVGLLLLEEGGRDERERIEVENRWLWTGAHGDLEGRKVIGEYTKVTPDERGQMVRRYLALDLDRWMPVGDLESDRILLNIGAMEVAAGQLDYYDLSGVQSSWDGLTNHDG